ncbi:MAG: ABC transporter ATP-binding protein [Bacteroidota bacterium]
MSNVVLKAENISKQYRLGQLGTGTISHDLNRFVARVRGKEDPYLKVGDTNDRSKAGGSDYVWSLRDVNFEVNKGEVLGVIGKNGAGKSTLLKILSQVTTPTTGEVKVKGRIAALLEVGTGFHPELSGRENIFLNGAILGMTKAEIKNKLNEIVEFSGVAKYLDTPVKRYSSGMTVRLGFAIAAHLEPEILIVDEVLAVGDAEFQEKCLGKMKDVSGQGRTVLFVSHNMAAIKSLCTTAILLSKGQLVASGKTNDVIAAYKAENENANFTGHNTNPKSSHKTEFGRILEVRMFNTLEQFTGEILFEEQIGIEITFDLKNDVNNLNIDFRLISNEGISIAHVTSMDFEERINAKAGVTKVRFYIENNFNPGVYHFEAGIHYPNESTIDYLDQALTFRISNLNEITNRSYLNNWYNAGYYRPKFKLTIQ